MRKASKAYVKLIKADTAMGTSTLHFWNSVVYAVYCCYFTKLKIESYLYDPECLCGELMCGVITYAA